MLLFITRSSLSYPLYPIQNPIIDFDYVLGDIRTFAIIIENSCSINDKNRIITKRNRLSTVQGKGISIFLYM